MWSILRVNSDFEALWECLETRHFHLVVLKVFLMMLGKLLHSVMVGYSIDPDCVKIVAGTVDLILLVH
jgi:hypothetical protein